MQNKLILVAASMFLAVSAMAGDGSFAVSAIPEALLRNAKSVKRLEEHVVEIKSPAKARIYERHVYTILSSEARDFGRYRSFYDKFTSINYITGTLYDQNGRELKRVKMRDMKDQPVYDGISMKLDTRCKVNEFYSPTYPYTVGYEEEDDKDGVFSLPLFMPLGGPDMSCQYAKYVIIAPEDYPVRYKAINFPDPPVITRENGRKTYTWEVRNTPAILMEPLIPSWREIVPNIMFAPSLFELEGYSGDMSTWAQYGKFFYGLIRGRDQLPDNIKKTVHALTDGLADKNEKIYALYNYLQNNTHYISIQLGIGGWQPYDAAYVANNRYGDCKALSNYMVALLKEAGITGKYVVVNAGRDAYAVREDFSSNQFNHVICCVPMGKDTVWLECTDQQTPAGYMGDFTGNRKAVIIDETGGTLVSTPRYGWKENRQVRHTTASLDGQGGLQMEAVTRYSAVSQDGVFGRLSQQREKVMEELKAQIDLPQFDVVNYDYSVKASPLPEVKEILQLKAENYAQFTGKRIFLLPNILSRAGYRLAADEDRKFDLELGTAYTALDSVEIRIPPGYRAEALPAAVKAEGPFGKFSSRVAVEGDKILYYRSLESYSGRFPPSAYNELVKFREQIYRADNTKAVFVKAD